MKAFLPIIILLSSLTSVSFAQKMDTPDVIDGTTRVSAVQLIDLFDEYDDLVLIDSRIPKDRAGGHIEGSVSLPDTETTPESLAKAIPSKTTPVAFYCNGVKCGRSVKASKMAVSLGYTKVFWFRGGWEEWTSQGLPIEK